MCAYGVAQNPGNYYIYLFIIKYEMIIFFN